MARPDRRRHYLDTAMQLFAEHGFVGTTTDMIVAAAGGSKATLYNYFPSKQDLIAGLMDEIIATIGERASGPVVDDLSLRDALTQIGLATLRGVVSPPAVRLVRLALGEYTRFPELARVLWDHGPAITYARFHAFVDERARRGEVTVPDAQLAAEQFIAGIVGHVQMKVAMGISDAPSSGDMHKRVASAVDTFVARYAL